MNSKQFRKTRRFMIRKFNNLMDVFESRVDTTIFDDEPDVLVFLREKKPKFIEVREYLHKGSNGYVLHNSIQRNLHQTAADIEALPHFIRWIDEDWRKIYI